MWTSDRMEWLDAQFLARQIQLLDPFASSILGMIS